MADKSVAHLIEKREREEKRGNGRGRERERGSILRSGEMR